MALLVKFSDKGIDYENIYGRIAFGPRDKALSKQQVVFKCYATKEYREKYPNNYFFLEKINVLVEDFEKYFSDDDLMKANINLESQGYLFLKSIDNDSPECNYDCIINYSKAKND